MPTTRKDVLDFVMSHGCEVFTTLEVSAALGVKEYSVRGAVAWLKLGGFIEDAGKCKHREHVKLYRWTGKTAAIISIRRDRMEREVQFANLKASECIESSSLLSEIMMCWKKR